MIESINAYLISLSSHSCYWTSPDVALFILNQVLAEEKNDSSRRRHINSIFERHWKSNEQDMWQDFRQSQSEAKEQ